MRQNYVTFDFDKFDEAGLAPVKEAFEKAGMKVIDLEASNKATRMSGHATKLATFYFADGQRIALRIKGDGSVFQVQMNGRAIPIQAVDNLTGAVDEMARFLNSNSAAWIRAQRTKQKKTRVNAEDLKGKAVPRAQRIEQLTNDLEELRKLAAELESENRRLQAEYADREQRISALKQQLGEDAADTEEA